MRVTRIYIDAPLAVGKQVLLPEQAATHLTRVLRLRAGAALTLFNGQGGEYVAELLAIERGAARAAVVQQLPIERESPLRLTLLQGISRGERMDLIVQKATELGIERLVPIAAEHGVVKLDPIQGIRRVEHWQAIAISACEQCGRNRVPTIGAVQSLAKALEALPSEGARLLLDPEGAMTLAGVSVAGAASVLIGPEGGWSESERRLCERAGISACRLGPRVLRTETAPLAVLAALQALHGDLAG
jgi:16S rRNA (uracil1498-N3)-methyltransferase